jgi:hypothetical protein
MARAAIAGCGLLALAACSGGTGDTAPPTTVTTTTSVPPTTVAPSTTSAPTTTLSPQLQDEAEIRALHDRFFRMLVVTGNPPNPDHPEIAATTTGIQRQRMAESVQRMVQLGQRTEGDIRGRVVELHFLDADRASVIECSRSTSSLLNSDGSVAIGPPDHPVKTELRVLRSSDRWLVEDWFTGGDVRCEL